MTHNQLYVNNLLEVIIEDINYFSKTVTSGDREFIGRYVHNVASYIFKQHKVKEITLPIRQLSYDATSELLNGGVIFMIDFERQFVKEIGDYSCAILYADKKGYPRLFALRKESDDEYSVVDKKPNQQFVTRQIVNSYRMPSLLTAMTKVLNK